MESGHRYPTSHSSLFPALSGYWTWDIKKNLVFGDENLAAYFGIDPDSVETGHPIERFLSAIHKDDATRVRASIDRTITYRSEFREAYRVMTRTRGERRILAAGQCTFDAIGKPAQFPGWFVDVSAGWLSSLTALKIGAHLLEQARDTVAIAGSDFLVYLIDNNLEEIGREIKREARHSEDGKRRKSP